MWSTPQLSSPAGQSVPPVAFLIGSKNSAEFRGGGGGGGSHPKETPALPATATCAERERGRSTAFAIPLLVLWRPPRLVVESEFTEKLDTAGVLTQLGRCAFAYLMLHRSNRKRGTKIMRCFPHCCPDHKPRCYCGCSLHILVTFVDASIVRDDEIVICARFETSITGTTIYADGTARKLSHGERVTLPPEIVHQWLPQDSVESVWVRAYRESEGRQRKLPPNSILYVMNNYRFPKWYYGYESGATKSQREMKHYLRAYVMRLELAMKGYHDAEFGRGGQIATVIGRHASPGFTLLSYRRAGENQRRKKLRAGGAVFNESENSSQDGSSTDSERDVPIKIEPGIPDNARHFGDAQSFSVHDDDGAGDILLGLRYGSLDAALQLDTKPLPSAAESQFVHDQAAVERQMQQEMDEKLFWQSGSHAKTMKHVRELSILHHFIAHLAMDGEFWECVVQLESDLRQHWTEMPMQRANNYDRRSRVLLSRFSLSALTSQHSLRHHGSNRGPGASEQHYHVLSQCADLLVEAFTSAQLHELATSTFHVHSSIFPTKLEQWEQFAGLMNGVYKVLTNALCKSNTTIPSLVDEILTCVHQCEMYKEMRGPLRELMRIAAPKPAMLRGFCAQTREVFIAWNEERKQSRHLVSRAITKQNYNDEQWRRRWDGRWLLDSDTFRLRHIHGEHENNYPKSSLGHKWSQYKVFEVLSTIQQLSSVQISLCSKSASLEITSGFAHRNGSIRGEPWPFTRLTLDGKHRVFRAFPNGISTMAATRDGEWVYGDYVGVLDHSTSSITLWFYAFKKPAADPRSGLDSSIIAARCISMRLQLQDVDSLEAGGSRFEQIIAASVSVGHATCTPATQKEADVDVLSSRARHAMWETLQWTPHNELKCEYQQL
ncbi:hypothetical protein FI667_g16871, partial [Globisporangium splendens]